MPLARYELNKTKGPVGKKKKGPAITLALAQYPSLIHVGFNEEER